MNPSGNIFYKDDYGTIYEIEWSTVETSYGSIMDTTTITKQPFVWAEAGSGYIEDKAVYRNGICTTERLVVKILDDGYEVLAEGSTQEKCTFQTTFPCTPKPSDPFLHHLDYEVCDCDSIIVSCGTRWSDPDNSDDDIVLWSDVETDGTISYIANSQPFLWIDVWSSNDETSVCST